jgi:hypothetical protein
MNIFARAIRIIFGDDFPSMGKPEPRRRIRVTCEVCGKSIAVIASTGRLWRHRCEPVEVKP